MWTLAPQDTFSRWLDQSPPLASKYGMVSFQLLIDRFQLRAKVGRNRLAESDWSFPFSAPLDNGLGSEYELYYWVEHSSETSAVPTSFRVVSPKSVEEWHRWRWLTEYRFARWRETFAGVKLTLRLVTQAWQLLLKTLRRPLFADHFSHKEHLWMLLHGAHPPRQDAGIFRPAFAQSWEGLLRISRATS
jgi:hypothetical protein